MKNFAQWCAAHQQPVTIHSVRDVAALQPFLAEFMQRQPPRRRMCFDNALALAKAVPNSRYVIGRTQKALGDHAWNELGGMHFDVTAEFAYGAPLSLGEYHAIIIISFDEARAMSEFRTAPTLPDVWMARHAHLG